LLVKTIVWGAAAAENADPDSSMADKKAKNARVVFPSMKFNSFRIFASWANTIVTIKASFHFLTNMFKNILK
jgi:hypothetical protein